MKTTLTSIFDSNKETLAQKLNKFSLPKDSLSVEKTVSDFLNEMFESDGDYRLSLTQSEDYILQSSIQLLKAQQIIAIEISSKAAEFNKTPGTVTDCQKESNLYTNLLGTGIGALAGGTLGTWGAVCGAIAGTAIAIYLSTSKKTKQVTFNEVTNTINVNAFINIVKKICESIDNVMETYRVQVKRIENSYKNIEEESPLSKYSHLFSQIEYLHEVIESEKPQVPDTVVDAEASLIRSLRNYGLSMENGKIVSTK